MKSKIGKKKKVQPNLLGIEDKRESHSETNNTTTKSAWDKKKEDGKTFPKKDQWQVQKRKTNKKRQE